MVVSARGDDLGKFAQALRDAEDDLLGKLGDRFRKIGRPIGLRSVKDGAGDLPESGGLAARIRGTAAVDVDLTLRGRIIAAGLGLSARADLDSLERGILRHKVFDRPGRTPTWVQQPVPANAFERALERRTTEVRKAALGAVNEVLRDVARKV